jgi:hypothetical protein
VISYSEVDLWTDPDAMWACMVDSTRGCDLLTARAMAVRLWSWMMHEGPPPEGMRAGRVLERCDDIIRWADCMLEEPRNPEVT